MENINVAVPITMGETRTALKDRITALSRQDHLEIHNIEEYCIGIGQFVTFGNNRLYKNYKSNVINKYASTDITCAETNTTLTKDFSKFSKVIDTEKDYKALRLYGALIEYGVAHSGEKIDGNAVTYGFCTDCFLGK